MNETEIIRLKKRIEELENALLSCEKKLNETNADKYRHLAENANEAILVIQNSKIVFLNPKGEALLEYSKQELFSKAFTEFIHHEDRKMVENRYQRRMKGETIPDVYPFRIVTKSSQIKWVELKVALFYWEGAPATLCFLTDVTDQYRSEKALEKRILSLTQPLESSGEVIFEDLFNIEDIQRLQDEFAMATGVASIITKPDGTPITEASNFCRLCRDIIRKTEKGLENCFKSDAIIGRYNPDGPIIQTCLSGGLWDAGSAISIGGQHVANWLIGQVRDETQSEEKISDYAHEIGVNKADFLEAYKEVPSMSRERFGKVAQVLFTLANQLSTTAYQNVQQARFISELKLADKKQRQLQDQLNHAQKMESVGRLAGGVAHDFNNMLSIILGNADMIIDDIDPGSTIHYKIEEIHKAAERSADLTRQLLAFARKQTIAPKLLDLNQMIKGMLNMLRRLIGEDIELAWVPKDKLWPVKIDPSQIDQILANLCVNARDSITGNGRIVIATDNVSFDEQFCRDNSKYKPGSYVQISFSDNGCGMDPETVKNIFEPFFTTKSIGEGTGLGLATVYGIIKQNNGFIDVSSKIGMGSIFKIYFPGIKKDQKSITDVNHDRKLQKGIETILIVEDEKAILEMTQMMLERMGYKVISAQNPKEAVKITETAGLGSIHMLITDVVMPEMNGRELSRRIQKIYPEVKCLFMSGYTADIIAHHGVLDKGIQFINKPFSMAKLAAKVRNLLDQD